MHGLASIDSIGHGGPASKPRASCSCHAVGDSSGNRQLAIKGGADGFVYFPINEPKDLCIYDAACTQNAKPGTAPPQAKLRSMPSLALAPRRRLFALCLLSSCFAHCYPYACQSFLAVVPGYLLGVYKAVLRFSVWPTPSSSAELPRNCDERRAAASGGGDYSRSVAEKPTHTWPEVP